MRALQVITGAIRAVSPLLALSFFLCVSPTSAPGHIGSSERVNNRYYKFTPMSDRVRVAYTIFFGREPGMVTRRQMDTDRDGQLSLEEVSSYGMILAGEIEKSVRVELDDRPYELHWQDADMGMGTPVASGGPFSVDFVGTVCLETRNKAHEHRLLFRDRLRLPMPGETELYLDPAPGIHVSASEIDGRTANRQGERWQGGPGPAQEGYRLAFRVESDETAGLDSLCTPPPRTRTFPLFSGLLGFGVLLAGALLVARRATR